MIFLRSCLVGFLALALSAQIQNARVEGTVTDASQSVIPGAKVTIINVKTQAKLETQTNASGFFAFPVLQPGIHSLTAEANGFKKATVTNIEITVGITLRQDVALEPVRQNERYAGLGAMRNACEVHAALTQPLHRQRSESIVTDLGDKSDPAAKRGQIMRQDGRGTA